MRNILVILTMLLASSSAGAQSAESNFSVAASSISGSYEKMLGEIISTCSNDRFEILMAPDVKGGGDANLEALANNKAQGAIVRSDVVTALAQADAGYKRFQTLVTLYHEPVHVVVLRESKSKKKGALAFGTVDFNSLAEIGADYSVGAGGGTVYTLKIFKGMAGAQYNIAQFGDSKSMMAALDSGEIAAAAFVGAAPLPNLLALDKAKYKLIPVGEQIVDKVKGIYKTMTVNYQGLSEGPVHTIGSQLVILTRKFSTKGKLDAQRHVRQCLKDNLPKLQDDGSPAWQNVDANDKGVLDWYEIP
jgi:TRAP-type uncharacterized transport system substrate-binding protein